MQFFLLLSLFQGGPAWSATLSLSDAIRASWRESPQITGQQTQADLASGDRWRRFILNEPQFTLTKSDDNTAVSYGVSLLTPFPGKTLAATKGDVAKEAQQQAELYGKKQDLAKTVAQAYLDCASNEALSRIQRENIADLSTVQSTLNALYQSGHSSQSDTIQAGLQLRQAQNDLRTLEDKTVVSCRKYEATLAASGVQGASTDLSIPEDVDPSILHDLGGASADLLRAQAAERVASANHAFAWWSQLPDLTISAQRNHYLYLPGSPSGKEWTSTWSISFTVPIFAPLHEVPEASRSRSQADIDRSTASLQRVGAESDEEDASREYRRSKARLAELDRKDLSLAEALRDSVLSAYRAGKVGFADLMLAKKTYSDLRAQEIQLRSSVIMAHLRCLEHCEEGNRP